jgi:DNA (cytosine-5)-methyltransferase 1
MRVLSVCSGIGAPECAWAPLGFNFVAQSEIDTFPSAVLAHRFPGVPNWGDMTKFKEWPDAKIDVLVGGTPCQSFSVAGLRKGMEDPRGNLALTFCGIADRYRPEWIVWENVPGVLSSNGGRDFGSFLGALAQLGYGFAYRVLDAQYFGVAQRRKRVFVVANLRDWRRAAAVLFERESLQGHPAPSREQGKVAPTIPARRSGGGGLGTDFDCDGGLIAEALGARTGRSTSVQDAECGHMVTQAPARFSGCQPVALQEVGKRTGASTTDRRAGVGISEPGDPMFTLQAGAQHGVALAVHENQRAEISVSDTAGYLKTSGGKPGQGYPAAFTGSAVLSHALRGEGFDASEDGTGRGTPLVPVSYRTSGNCGAWETGDKTDALATATDPNHHVLAFSSKDHGADAGEIAPTLRAMGHSGSHANAGGQLAVALAVHENQRAEISVSDTAGYLKTSGGKPGQGYPAAFTGSAVRRLTPRECERLQGFPDDWTAITHRNKPAADGSRYKALGNSMAVPVLRWIGERIKLVEFLGV